MSNENKNSKLYNADSIESLSPLEFTLLRPQVYAGDCTYSTQLLVEILSNAIDEFNLGHGNQIDITILGDKVIVETDSFAVMDACKLFNIKYFYGIPVNNFYDF